MFNPFLTKPCPTAVRHKRSQHYRAISSLGGGLVNVVLWSGQLVNRILLSLDILFGGFKSV